MVTWPRLMGPVTPLILSPWFAWPHDRTAVVGTGTENLSRPWAIGNEALYFPIEIFEDAIITKLWWQNGATVSGNVDCGVYTENGNRLVSTGSLAQAGVNAIQAVDVPDTTVPSGLLYLALVASTTAATFWIVGSSAITPSYGFSGYRQASALPLPNPATFATTRVSGMIVPKFGALVAPRTVI
jgi:hypothetical protein